MIRHRQGDDGEAATNARTPKDDPTDALDQRIDDEQWLAEDDGDTTPPPVFILEKQKKTTQQRMTEIISIWTKVKIENIPSTNCP